jgi:hypothetical protein
MDEEMRKEFPFEVRVKLEGFIKYKGYSDLVTTYCCSATPCYFVVFSAIGYEGYFEAKDVIFEKDVKAGRM